MKVLRILVVLVLAVFLSMLAMGAGKQDPWKLRIVPTRSSAKHGTMIDSATKDSCFYVVLSNTSQADMSVWREWCSWGYFCLSFDMTLPDSKTIHVKKKPRSWKKNYPDPFIVKKGSHFVYAVSFNEMWEGFPDDWKNQKVKLKAIFSVEKEDDQAGRHKVWIGKVESPEIEVQLYK